MLPSFVRPEIIPHKPGIYIYKDSTGKVIYVGKAVDLFSRVSSYFNNTWKDVKTAKLVENIASAETIIVESEIEALILEANLIKKFLPLYNIRLTDDKDYLYVVVTDEEFPKVLTARKKDLIKVKKWFGPYPSATTVKDTLNKLRRIFPWCSGKYYVSSIKYQGKVKAKPCFYYHIGLCSGPCAGVISRGNYLKILNRFSKFLDGKKTELLDELNEEMEQYSKELRFEEAAKIKKIIDGVNYVTAPTKITNYLVNPNFLQDLSQNSLAELQSALNLLELPVRIEAYDISNMSGKDATGSMVVLTNGEIDKSQYRRFKIKITGKPNDYAMHAEMMGRRLKHNEWPLPQLFLIDGGRGQVTAVKQVIDKIATSDALLAMTSARSARRVLEGSLRDHEVARQSPKNIPIFGLAKREEWLYPPEGDVVKLPKKNLGLRLLQKIRNESHRFAINYHKKLRTKAFLPNKH